MEFIDIEATATSASDEVEDYFDDGDADTELQTRVVKAAKGVKFEFLTRKLAVQFLRQERASKYSPAKDVPTTKTLAVVLKALKETAKLFNELKRERISKVGKQEYSYVANHGKFSPAMLATAKLVFDAGQQFDPDNWVRDNNKMLRDNYKVFLKIQQQCFDLIKLQFPNIEESAVIKAYGEVEFTKLFLAKLDAIAAQAQTTLKKLPIAKTQALPATIDIQSTTILTTIED